jgi:cyclopropane-fatty-acyl-phospholipid synthase
MEEQAGGRSASAQAIQFHYDVGTEFYRLWLDRECVYSCALWSARSESLEQAQVNKLEYMLRESQIKAGERLLEIGCGWGGLLRRAAHSYHVESAHGLTLAETQAAYITSQADVGVSAKVEDWQQHVPREPYDAIISIGAFEHFARPDLTSHEKVEAYQAFFRRCYDWLKPERYLALQTITYENAGASDVNPFLRDHNFPESELPHVLEILRAAKHSVWGGRLRENRKAAIALVGKDTVDRYERYLKLARLGFMSGNLGLVRITFRRLRDYRSANTNGSSAFTKRKEDVT